MEAGMKNMMITLGAILIMAMSIFYQWDCMRILAAENRLGWIGQEIAEGVSYILWDGKEEMQENKKSSEERVPGQEATQKANAWARDFLKRNLALDQAMMPESKQSVLTGPVKYALHADYPGVEVIIDGGAGQMILPFLKENVQLKSYTAADYFFESS